MAAAEGAADGAEETEEDECPVWQNPLHHNNPEFKKVLAEGTYVIYHGYLSL